MKKVALSNMKDDLSRFLRMAEKEPNQQAEADGLSEAIKRGVNGFIRSWV